MLAHEFGIIDDIDKNKDYGHYCPQLYHCIKVDDDIILSVIHDLKLMRTYFHDLQRPEFGLAYYGVTLIPPESLSYFEDVFLKLKIKEDLSGLFLLIKKANFNHKHMIHFGI